VDECKPLLRGRGRASAGRSKQKEKQEETQEDLPESVVYANGVGNKDGEGKGGGGGGGGERFFESTGGGRVSLSNSSSNTSSNTSRSSSNTSSIAAAPGRKSSPGATPAGPSPLVPTLFVQSMVMCDKVRYSVTEQKQSKKLGPITSSDQTVPNCSDSNPSL